MPDAFDPAAAAHKAVDLLGGPVQTARTLGVDRYQTVQSWTRNRIPAEYCPSIERALEGRMKCEEMRPDVDWAYLRLAAGLPSEPEATPAGT